MGSIKTTVPSSSKDQADKTVNNNNFPTDLEIEEFQAQLNQETIK